MFKSFLRYRYKTLLILVSATSAIASIFLITALGNGIISMYASMLKTDGDIIVMQKGVADTFFSDINRSLLVPIAKIPGVKSAQGVIVGAGAIDSVPIAGIYGVTKNRLDNYTLTEGHYPQKEGEVIVGESIASILKNPEEITLMGEPFRVSGIYKSDIGFENGGVVIAISDAGKLFHKSASFLLISLKDLSEGTEKVIRNIRALDTEVDVRSTTDFIDNYNQFKIIRISSGVIASISFFMGFLAIVSLMSMMVSDRRYEFGIKRAMGIPKHKIILQILIEVITLTLVAFILAYGISLLLLDQLQHIEKFQGYLSGEIDMLLFVRLLIGSIAMAAIGALVPALIAARVDPIILINRGQ
ncbi:ABC transporter permease [Sulfurovum riftiae]|uniref:ABC transporter permease n=1 Tax=Sulfurovum riftiae TaxID=1630136 RepID=A0A151CE84_9BACT|nr:FtsX-like permease family protein [Sulfurovum riftiae]KYJ85846.1 ABC transporter permease [Sulfurovum riftiae]